MPRQYHFRNTGDPQITWALIKTALFQKKWQRYYGLLNISNLVPSTRKHCKNIPAKIFCNIISAAAI